MRLMPLFLALTVLPATAAGHVDGEPVPEIDRPQATAQAVGVAHTLRTIPEACARLEGAFTGDAREPYKFAAVRTSPNCRPRARFIDAAKAEPSVDTGWLLNDVIRVPSAACPAQQAVVRVWRKPLDSAKPQLDGQGNARIYLGDAKQAAAGNATAVAVPMFAAEMALEGMGCG